MAALQARFEAFETTPPVDLLGDAMWRLPAYRIAALLAIVCREDAVLLMKSTVTARIAEQLIRSVDSIGANIAEGYGRASGRERARFFEFALGSAREAREWYRRAAIGEHAELLDRVLLLTRGIKILTVAVRRERTSASENRIRKG